MKPLTIEHRIANLIVDRLKDCMINGALAFVREGVPNASSLKDRMVLGGTVPTTIPRKFELLVTATGKVRVKETTLWADLGTQAPAPYLETIDFVAGVPFDIAGTGVTATLASTYKLNDEWIVRIANAYSTIVNIVSHPFDFTSLPTPSISVYFGITEDAPVVTEKIESTVPLEIMFCVDANTFSSGKALEMIGDIRDCINRDRSLWDNTECLAANCICNSHQPFDLTDNGVAIFNISSTITYRSNKKNARIK